MKTGLGGTTQVLITADMLAATAVACTITVVLVAFHMADPHHQAMRHYARVKPLAFHVMQGCLVLLSMALAFNARYVMTHVAHVAFGKVVHQLAKLRVS